MSQKIYGSLFTGGGLADIGAQAAGFTHAWGVEIDQRIAEVSAANGFLSRVMDVLDADPHDFERVDWLHASPPCVRASAANTSAEVNEDGTKETQLDVDMATKVAEFIDVLKPDCVTIENVRGYAKFSRCMAVIQDALMDGGYWWHNDILNCADFGVPQTRIRMVMRAVRGAMPPPLPAPVRWVGWYEAIEDLIDTLPESCFADWQLKRLPATITDGWLINSENAGQGWGGTRIAAQPAMTLSRRSQPRAFVVANGKYGDDLVIRDAVEPLFTTTANSNQTGIRLWLSQGRVVQMTARALARFQSLPDSYKLPDSNALAVKIIGNGVPSLLMQQIGEAWV